MGNDKGKGKGKGKEKTKISENITRTLDIKIEHLNPENHGNGKKILKALGMEMPIPNIENAAAWKKQLTELREEAMGKIDVRQKNMPSTAAILSQIFRSKFADAYTEFRNERFQSITDVNKRNNEMKKLTEDDKQNFLKKIENIIKSNNKHHIELKKHLSQTGFIHGLENFTPLCIYSILFDFAQESKKLDGQSQCKIINTYLDGLKIDIMKNKYNNLQEIKPKDSLTSTGILNGIFQILVATPPLYGFSQSFNINILDAHILDSELILKSDSDSDSDSDNSFLANSPSNSSSSFIKEQKAEQFFTFIQNGDFKNIEKLIQNGIPIDFQDKEGNTALHYAIMNYIRKNNEENLSIITMLLTYDPNFYIKKQPRNKCISFNKKQPYTYSIT